MLLKILIWSLVLVALLAVALVLAGRLGLFKGTPPNNLGVRDGRLKAPSGGPNSVSSQAALYPEHPMREYAQIAPLAPRGDAIATMAKLLAIVATVPGARVVKSEGNYVYTQFTTRLMGFVDDTEFWFDPSANVMQVRSSSRVGRKDYGVNRARIEAIRARLAGS